MRRGSVWPATGRSRRGIIIAVAWTVFASFALTGGAIRADSGDRTISIYNIHTKNTVTATYKRNSAFDKKGLAAISRQMRDWRAEKEIAIDPELVDLLWQLHRELDSKQPIWLISGFRSSETNEMLRRTRGGQAQKSLHILGKAADVYFPDVPLERLRNAALVRERGGVGYYPGSGQPFVHVDTGSVRHWPRLPDDQLASIMNGKGHEHGPAALPEPVRIASSADVEAVSPPRAKPASAASGEQPIRFAAAGEALLEPSPVRTASLDTGDPRDWGQSWLLPSAPRAALPGTLAPADMQRASRVVVTASAEPVIKSDAPLAAGLAMGYAGLPEAERSDRVSGLLTNGTGDLARLLAEAQSIGAAGAANASRDPTDLRPAALIHNRAELPTRPDAYLPAPVMTASLAPAAMIGRSAEPGIARRLRATLGGPSLAAAAAPQALDQSYQLMRGILSAPASHHALTFTRTASAAAFDATFAPAPQTGMWSVIDAERVETPSAGGIAGALAAVAERAFGWIFGN